ncbi:putative elongator complex protein 1 [Orussus abietinus]|uniref:putative elongator complex protein 1 n=1 Tax=Orussus abietinus TaxID=222816 RepID=UPI000625523B|nr:putative elongator complex protein 1 [Orussus abietinus]
MKNLTVHCQSIHNLNDLRNHDLPSVLKRGVMCCHNPDADNLYIFERNRLYGVSTNVTLGVTLVQIDVSEDLTPVGLEYCSVSQQLYCAYDSGDVAKVFTREELECEEIVKVNGGLRCIKLSPDHEILILITLNDTVITMTSSFHVISEVDLYAASFGKKQFITVGWGKKETQFHGSQGKTAAKETSVITGKTELDDGTIRITWRGDGMLFAVTFLHKDTVMRQFKVFNREGILQYTSEPSSGLEQNISWKPFGNVIALTQRLNEKHVVAFFEKNGLKHREFTLSLDVEKFVVKDLLWSLDAEVLTVWCEEIKTKNIIVQLWTQNNYHWYLKQSIVFSTQNSPIFLTWHAAPKIGKKLILLTSKDLITYSFRWVIDHSKGKDLDDKAIVAVIDNDRALLTAFRLGIIPPPMMHQALQTDEPINTVVFPPGKTKESLTNSNMICILNNQKLLFYVHNDSNNLEYMHVNSYDIEWGESTIISEDVPYSMHHFLWLKDDTLLCSASSSKGCYFCNLQLDGMNVSKEGRVTVRKTYILDGCIQHIVSCPDLQTAYIVVEGSVFKYSEDEGICPTDIKLDEFTHQIEVIDIGSRNVIVSLTSRNCLYIDGKEAASNILSFFVHSEFLLLTTLQHTLICVTLDDRGFDQLSTQDLTVKPWKEFKEQSSIGLSMRRVERSSSLVIAIPKDCKVILQMPRGNLECIQPRALSLYIIGNHLDNLQYFAAFELIRKQRINLNLIVDHDPRLFLENATKFIDDIIEPTWLSFFLSELQNDDVTVTTYATSYPLRSQKSGTIIEDPYAGTNKVQRVCKTLLDIMIKKPDANKLIPPILTSMVKQENGLEIALKKIKSIRESEDKPRGSLEKRKSEEALNYLLYLTDVNVLYDIALGMYDFEMTMLIASKSQKDPKEYIPFLNDLKKLESNYMKYCIDKHLMRYESALAHISKRPDKFSECLDFIHNHSLYVQALQLFNRDSKEYQEVAKIYAEFLSTKMKHREAGIMFSRAGDLKNSLNAFKLASCWQEVIIVSIQMELSSIELSKVLEDLVSQLKYARQYKEAAEILITHLHKTEDAVAMLCEGRMWQDALRLCYFEHRLDLIETRVKPRVQDHTQYIMSQIEKAGEDFQKHRTRLAKVREEKSKQEMQIHNGLDSERESAIGRDISDLLSDTSSIAGTVTSHGSTTSKSSGRSYRSSKNRRKQERKLLSTKEGSAFEDFALLRTLHQTVIAAYEQRDEVEQIVRTLLHFNEDEHAGKLQKAMCTFLNMIEIGKLEIWSQQPLGIAPEITKERFNNMENHSQNNIPQGLIEPFMLYAPVTKARDWKLNIFSSISEMTKQT